QPVRHDGRPVADGHYQLSLSDAHPPGGRHRPGTGADAHRAVIGRYRARAELHGGAQLPVVGQVEGIFNMRVQPVRTFERGQVLPLVVLALLGLAGFAALAVDGGNLYTEQRRAQAAADDAVMAAAYQAMYGYTGATLSNAAFTNATQNGYTTGAHTKVVFYLP